VLIITAGVIAAAWLTAQAIQTIYDDLSREHHHHHKKRKVVTCTRCEM
jgi:hypothetical protein